MRLPTPLLSALTLLTTVLPSPTHAAQAGTSPKRGLIYIPSSKHPTDDNIWARNGSDLTWYYTYGATPVPAFNNLLEFVPMLWGLPSSPSDTSFYDTVKSQLTAGQKIRYVLTFNEPDGEGSSGGSNIDPAAAAAAWVKVVEPLKQSGIRLGAPAVTGAPSGFSWLQAFFKACNGGCSADFIPIHWYGNFEGMEFSYDLLAFSYLTYPQASPATWAKSAAHTPT
jgi:Glycosyl hydrolase catalytic core